MKTKIFDHFFVHAKFNMSSSRSTGFSFFAGVLCFCLIGISQVASAQNAAALVDRANKFFELAKNYDAALPLYEEAIQAGANDAMVHYRLGVCYTQSPTLMQQVKAIPHFERSLQSSGADKLPAEIYYYMGQVYHKDIEIQKAIDSYEKYKKTANKDSRDAKPLLKDTDRQLIMCNNALFLINESNGAVINKFGQNVNTANTEYNPIVTADESMMAYTALREERGKLVEKIFITEKSSGNNWSVPKEIEIKTDLNVGTAGISPDGQEMIVFVGGANRTGNLYTIKKTGNSWSVPTSLGTTINSNYLESTASITPNGKTMYFASNRPQGYGGMDIYKSEKGPDGKWGRPVNLGPEINTEYDEDAPFIHPDSKTLFFTSNNLKSMGGYDIFKSYQVGGKWQAPDNLGYPINTPTDDNYFTLTANGKMGYFSSDRKGGSGGQDIYYFEMPSQNSNIPLTLVKGRILAGEDEMKPVPTVIKVVDIEAQKKIDYVYNPEPSSGNYLIILPPGKNYDLIIESEGYLPYTVNVNIPNQTFFYELYQEILLRPITQFGVVVGQEVSVKNAFHNVNEKTKTTVRQANEAMLVQNDSLDLYDMMDAIIASTDTAAYEYLLNLMYSTNPIEDVDFSKVKEEKLEVAAISYYYDETGTDNLEAKKVGNETVYTLPTFYVTEEAIKQKNKKPIASNYDKSLLQKVQKVFFDIGASKFKDSYKPELQNIVNLLNKYPTLGVEISGYASPEGNAEDNQKLSNQRAIEVLNFFNQQNVVRRRIVAKGYGATSGKAGSGDESRRVEIRLIDLDNYIVAE